MNVTLRQLRAFAAVADEGSFTEAARSLYLTQSAVSMLVKQLEGEFGLPLFNRAGRRITLTETGKQLLPLARRMLDDLRQVIDGAVDLRTLQRGTVRVSASQVLACTWIPDALARFQRSHPNISIRLVDTSADDVVGAVQRHEVEMGVGPERPTSDDVACDFLWRVPMLLVCAPNHALTRRKRVNWTDLKGERWVTYSAEFTRHLERTLAEHDIDLAIGYATPVNHLTTALALTGRGLGITVAPAYARSLAQHFNVRFLPIGRPTIDRAFHLYRRCGHPLSPAAATFVEQLRQRPQD